MSAKNAAISIQLLAHRLQTISMTIEVFSIELWG